MSIDYVKEIWNGRTGMEDDTGRRDYARAFMFFTTSVFDGSKAILDYVGNYQGRAGPTPVPQRFDMYTDDNGDSDSGALCKSRTPRQDEGFPLKWILVCEYTTDILDALLGNRNPLLRRAVPKWATEKSRKPYAQDASGRAAGRDETANSCGEPLDPAPERDTSTTVFTISKNIDLGSWNPALQKTYRDKVASDSFYGYPAFDTKCDSLDAEESTEAGIDFVRVTGVFRIPDPDPDHPASSAWTDWMLDAGFRQLAPDGVTLIPIRDPLTTQPYATPTLLDGSGHAQLTYPGVPAYRDFQPYKEIPFAPLATLFGPISG